MMMQIDYETNQILSTTAVDVKNSEDSLVKMYQRFKKCFQGAFNFDEALERQKLSRDGIELLRTNLKSSKFVPKFLVDNQVILKL